MATMKLIGFLFALIGLGGLLAGVGLEIGAATSLSHLAHQWLLSYLLEHRMMIVAVSGFILVAGVILFGFAGTQRAIALQIEVIREAINTPDVCPAAPLLLNVPAPPVELDAVRPLAGAKRKGADAEPLPRQDRPARPAV